MGLLYLPLIGIETGRMVESNNNLNTCSKLEKLFIGRRELLQKLGWAGVLGLLAGTVYSSLRFFFPKVLYEPAGRFEAGSPNDYSVGTVSEIWKDEQKIWLVRTEKGLFSLISICTHLGCTPNWFDSEQLFKCPCHGSVFTKDGDVVSGPAPEPLYRAPIELTGNGKILTGNGLLGIRLSSQANSEPVRGGEAFLLRL